MHALVNADQDQWNPKHSPTVDWKVIFDLFTCLFVLPLLLPPNSGQKESRPVNISDPICIQSGSAQKQATWFLHTSLLPGLVILAKTWHHQPELNQIWNIRSRSVCTTWSMPSLEKWNWIRCGKSDPTYTIQPDSGCMLAVIAITDHNQKASGFDPACLLGSLPKPFLSFFTYNDNIMMKPGSEQYCDCYRIQSVFVGFGIVK